MKLEPFKLERYFAEYEFKVKFLLSSSDCESLSMAELILMAGPDTLDLWQNLRLGYTESPGHPVLREHVAQLYDHTLPDNIIIAAPEEAIFIAMQTILSSDDHIITVSPAYQSLHEVARSIGCSITQWNLEPGAKGWHLDLNLLERAITDHTKMIIINFPHNPTGHTLSHSDFNAVVELAAKRGIYIFSDEMYRLLEIDPTIRLPSVCDVYEKGISLSGLSKSFALPGLRIGWLALREKELINRCLEFKDYTTICNSAPSEILAIIALQNKDQILQRNLDIIQGNIVLAKQFFSDNSNLFSWFGPKAGSVSFPEWLGEIPVEQFCKKVLEHRGVMIVPGNLFGFSGNHFRIGLGRKNFGEAIAILNGYIKDSGLHGA
ncbi:MAG: aminotransferase class I/II-fold pyridoxal phosphate-dependent enzyme [Desulfamplus sp.]|nr:aminotransferase class I/II-fold pyridoxal phosphate-dependent enzyme [Desulfamplus sp.]